MRTIQEVGTEILTGSPSKFYAMSGSEYGIKQNYIDKIKEVYPTVKEVETVKEVLDFMKTKHLFPPQPCSYIVRYDSQFIKDMNEHTDSEISNCNIIGCLVCIYQSKSDENCLEKYIPNWSVSINAVPGQFISKYLRNDFPNIPDQVIDNVVKLCPDYSRARNILRCMNCINHDDIANISLHDIAFSFGVEQSSAESNIRMGVSSRNFKYLIDSIEKYPSDLDSLLYVILSTLLEIEKLLSNSRIESDIRQFVKSWSLEDVYNMFMNTYDQLQLLRSLSSDTTSSLIMLFSSLQFSPIPRIMVNI